MSHDKHVKTAVKSSADPELTKAAAAGDPMAAALADEVAKDARPAGALRSEDNDPERYPATKAVMAARAAAFPAPELKDAVEVKKTLKPGGILATELEAIIKHLLERGGHAPLCPTRSHHLDACVCGWGEAEAEAKAALG